MMMLVYYRDQKASPASSSSDYSKYARFSYDRKKIYLTLKDGGFGDADGLENGNPKDAKSPSDSLSILSPARMGDSKLLDAII